MRTLLCLLLSISLTFTAAQNYHPFPTSNATWTYQLYDDFHQPTGNFIIYFMSGDTTFNINTYKKIYGLGYN